MRARATTYQTRGSEVLANGASVVAVARHLDPGVRAVGLLTDTASIRFEAFEGSAVAGVAGGGPPAGAMPR